MTSEQQHGPERRYLQSVPAALLNTLDLTLKVGEVALQVHSLIVASQSTVLMEAIVTTADSHKSQRVLPLVGDEVDTVTDALAYLYRRAFDLQPVKPCSILEAVRVAVFAHKYHCQNLSREVDLYLSSKPLPARSSQPVEKTGVGELANFKSWDVLEFLSMAQKFGLSRFSAHCEHWLLGYADLFESEHQRLSTLPSPCLARLARGLALKIPRPVDPFSPFASVGAFGRRSHPGFDPPQPSLQPTLAAVLAWHGIT